MEETVTETEMTKPSLFFSKVPINPSGRPYWLYTHKEFQSTVHSVSQTTRNGAATCRSAVARGGVDGDDGGYGDDHSAGSCPIGATCLVCKGAIAIEWVLAEVQGDVPKMKVP